MIMKTVISCNSIDQINDLSLNKFWLLSIKKYKNLMIHINILDDFGRK